MQYPGITGPIASRTIPHGFGDPFDFIITRQAPSPVFGNGQEHQDCDSINDKKCFHENLLILIAVSSKSNHREPRETNPFQEVKKMETSPNSLIQHFMNAQHGPGRKGRLRCKHRRDIAPHNLPLVAFRKAQRGHEKIGSEEKRTPPPKPTKDMCLMIASKMTFLPGPWNHSTFDLYHLFGPQLIWSSASANGNSLPSLYPLSSSQGERLE